MQAEITLRQAAQQALEALEPDCELAEWHVNELREKAITTLRAALAEPDSDYERGFVDGMNLQTKGSVDKAVNRIAEPEQEPVAWAVYDILHGGSKTLHWPEQHSPNGNSKQYKAVPLYTAPTPRKPLTDEMVKRMKEVCTSMEMRGAFADGWLSAEAAHGITGDSK